MQLSLTFDYELFGDGSGDVFQHMIHPTNEILTICKAHGIKSTLFFEVVEYLKLKEVWESGETMGYTENPIHAIEEQIKQAALNGHDIQLHIHPQWVNATWNGTSWQMDLTNWRLGDFKADGWTIERLLRESKDAVEQLVRQVIPDFECTILRAGGYNIMPSKDLFNAMVNVGLKADSSIYPGGFECGSLSKYDYSKVSLEKDHWWGDPRDLRNPSSYQKSILEIPIFAMPQYRFHKLLNFDKLKSILSGKKVEVSTVAKDKITSKGVYGKLKFLLDKEAFTWDFCLFSNYLHRKYFKYVEEKLINDRNHYVIIGHPKSYQSSRSLNYLIHQAHQRGFSFLTLKDLYGHFTI